MSSSVTMNGDSFLNAFFDRFGWPTIFCCDPCLVLGDSNGGKLCAIHASKGDKIATGIDDRDIQRPAALVGLRDRGLHRGLRFFK